MPGPVLGRCLYVPVAAGAMLLLAACSMTRHGEPASAHGQSAAPLESAAPRESAIPSGSSAAGDARPASSVDDARAEAPIVPPFSRAHFGESLPPGWESWIVHPRKKPTRYGVVDHGGRAVLRAQANASASGLLAKVDVDLTKTPFIEWSWRTDSRLEEADSLVASLEDSPARVVLAFEGDRTSLPLKDQLFFERVKLFTGFDMPYATLMYIWGNRKPVESVLANPHSQRIQKIVVNNGASGLKRWHRQRRNIVEDYRRAFGRPPGRLVGVAVMTDSDNTNGEVVAYYGDIRVFGRADAENLLPRIADDLVSEALADPARP